MKKTFFLLLLIATITGAKAQNAEVFTGKLGAINGYDPVAYFTDGKAVKGDAKFTYSWKDADWHFATAKNREEFKANPEKFAPQFGGYCAYGASQNHKAATEPEAFTIIDEKLYLNYNQAVRAIWRKDQKTLIEKANENWTELKKSKG